MQGFYRFISYSLVLILPIVLWAIIAIFLAFEGAWLTPVIQPNSKQSNNTSAFEQYALARLENEQQGQAAFALIESGQLTHKQVISRSTVRRAIDQHSVFPMASMSKFITAIGVLTLANQGKIDLNLPVNQYLTRWKIPSNQFDAQQVTIAQLLSHTSGLNDALGFGDYTIEETLPTLVASLNNPRASSGQTRIELGAQPGSTWQYSGGGYLILELLIEDVTGEPFAQWMQTHVFTPLGLTHSTYQYLGHQKNHSGSYDSAGNPAPIYQYASSAATGLSASLSDMIHLTLALSPTDINPRTLTLNTQQLTQQLTSEQAKHTGAWIWGLGAMLYAEVNKQSDKQRDNETHAKSHKTHYIFGHDGANDPAINVSLRINPVTRDAIVIFVTGHKTLASDIAFEWTLWQSGRPDFIMLDKVFISALLPIGLGTLLWLMVFIYWLNKRRLTR